MQDSDNDVRRTRESVARVAASGFDLIHANQFAAACADVDVPVVLTLHSDVLSWRRWTLGTSGVPAEWQAYVRLVREALERATCVVAVSSFLADQVHDLYGCIRDIRVIHNGWSATSTSGSKQPITLVAGRMWDAAKNLALAARAAQGWSPGDVLVAGELRHPEAGSSAEVPPPLRPLGHLRRRALERVLDQASVYLSPARYDPFGLLPLQAAQHGCALLLADIPSYRELWNDAATFFRSDDAADLQRAWRALLADPARRVELGEAARARAAACFSATRMAADYREVYRAACRRTVA